MPESPEQLVHKPYGPEDNDGHRRKPTPELEWVPDLPTPEPPRTYPPRPDFDPDHPPWPSPGGSSYMSGTGALSVNSSPPSNARRPKIVCRADMEEPEAVGGVEEGSEGDDDGTDEEEGLRVDKARGDEWETDQEEGDSTEQPIGRSRPVDTTPGQTDTITSDEEDKDNDKKGNDKKDNDKKGDDKKDTDEKDNDHDLDHDEQPEWVTQKVPAEWTSLGKRGERSDTRAECE